jgi:hypothetical protein
MNIQLCSICEKPFFPPISTTSQVIDFDPTACPKCNMEAIKNSKPILDYYKSWK